MRACLILLAAISLAQPAWGQPNDPAEAAYQEGLRLYDLREWSAAIAKFKEAYRLRPDPKSLFNIAQAYRLANNCVEAASFYKTYQRNYPTAPNIAAVEKFIAELEPCAKQAPPPPPERAGQPPPPPTPAAEPKRRAPLRTIGIASGAFGVAAVATGFVFGALAKSKADDVESNSGVLWDPELERAGRRDNLIAAILWAGGAAALVTGGVLYAIGGRSEAPVAVAPTRGGGSVLVRVRF